MLQDAESAAEVASSLAKLRVDMGKGKPIPLKKEEGSGVGLTPEVGKQLEVEMEPGGGDDEGDQSDEGRVDGSNAVAKYCAVEPLNNGTLSFVERLSSYFCREVRVGPLSFIRGFSNL